MAILIDVVVNDTARSAHGVGWLGLRSVHVHGLSIVVSVAVGSALVDISLNDGVVHVLEVGLVVRLWCLVILVVLVVHGVVRHKNWVAVLSLIGMVDRLFVPVFVFVHALVMSWHLVLVMHI